MEPEERKEIIDRLKKNPVYSMSLGGKELFHSNMLAWLLMRDGNKQIKNFFGIEENEVVLNVFRERKNLDLIIVYANKTVIGNIEQKTGKEEFDDPDSYLLGDESRKKHSCFDKLKFIIIENKFKSIPEKTQLEEYSKKLKSNTQIIYRRSFKNSDLRCFLFAPQIVLENALGFENKTGFGKSQKVNDVTWEAKSDEGYNDILKCLVDDTPEGIIIKYYSEMITDLLVILKKWLKEEDIERKSTTPDANNIELLKQIRFYDIYTKLWYGMTQKQIERKFSVLKNYPNRRFYGMTHSLGLFEWKYEYDEKLLVGVQIQNTSFRVFVEPYYKYKPNENRLFSSLNNISELEKIIKGWGSKILNEAFASKNHERLSDEDYKCLQFDNFKYVQRSFDGIMPKIDDLAVVILSSIQQFSDSIINSELENEIQHCVQEINK